MSKWKWRARTKHDLIVEVWEFLNCESVGATEIANIQAEVRAIFGEGAVEAPAAIARLLADEGAVLRHPEVLNFDTAWRQSEILKFASIDEFPFATLAEAVDSIKRLEARRQELAHLGEEDSLHSIGLQLKERSRLVFRSRIVDQNERTVAQEFARWLTVWLVQPEMFEEWLSLRRRSPEFIKTFGDLSS